MQLGKLASTSVLPGLAAWESTIPPFGSQKLPADIVGGYPLPLAGISWVFVFRSALYRPFFRCRRERDITQSSPAVLSCFSASRGSFHPWKYWSIHSPPNHLLFSANPRRRPYRDLHHGTPRHLCGPRGIFSHVFHNEETKRDIDKGFRSCLSVRRGFSSSGQQT